jgi:hypothetical protein
MSHHSEHSAIQRVVVRLLHDPAFVAALHRDPDSAFAGTGIGATGRAMLLRIDPRAWEHDPYRRARGLRALLEEFPVSGALWLRGGDDGKGGGGLSLAGGFFSSTRFHDCVQGRGVLALAFGHWLREGSPREQAALARVELAVARVRRGARLRRGVAAAPGADVGGIGGRLPPSTQVRLAPWIDAFAVPSGTLALHGEILCRVAAAAEAGGDASDPVERLLRAELEKPALPPLGAGDEHVVAEGGESGASMGFASPDMVALLEGARDPRSRAELAALARELGADADEADSVVDSLLGEGLLAPEEAIA